MFPSICIYSICAEVGGSNRRALEWSNCENVKFKSNLSELKQSTQHGPSCHLSHPVKDPITPIGILDRLSFIMGIHEQTSIVVLDLGLCFK